MARNGASRGPSLGNLDLKRGVCHRARKAAVGTKFPPVAIMDSRQNDLRQAFFLIFRKRVSAKMRDEINLVITRSKEISKEIRIGLEKLHLHLDHNWIPRFPLGEGFPETAWKSQRIIFRVKAATDFLPDCATNWAL